MVVIDLAGKSSMADFLIIASGTSARHISAMAEHILAAVKTLNLPPVAIEGAAQCDWVLIDTGDVVVHLFRPEMRAFYAIERLWGTSALDNEGPGSRRIRLGS